MFEVLDLELFFQMHMVTRAVQTIAQFDVFDTRACKGGLETADGLKNVEEIASVKGLDMLYVGPYLRKEVLQAEWERVVGQGWTWVRVAENLRAVVAETVKYFSHLKKLTG